MTIWEIKDKKYTKMRAYQNARKTEYSLSRCALTASKTTKASYENGDSVLEL